MNNTKEILLNPKSTGAMPPPPKANVPESNVPAVKVAKADTRFEPLAPVSFPDTIESNGKVKVQQTIPNMKHMLLAYDITVSYCAITKKSEISIPNLRGDPSNIGNTALTTIISLAKLNNMGTDQTASYIAAIADGNQKNPVADWVFSKSWDGIDRLTDLSDTLIVDEDFPVTFRNILIRRWLLSAIAAALMPSGFRSRGVLTLQGSQSIGKTSWLMSLVPDQILRDKLILIDHLLDVGNKDSITLAVSHWLVELGELESCFKRDQARLKGFITSPGDKIRAPYARAPSEYPRRTVFIATVNDAQFLIDATGNTRFWTIPVTNINYEHGIDMQQLWAQVAHIHQTEKEQWWLTPEEEKELETHNKQHRAISAIRDQLESRLDFDAPKDKWRKMTSSNLLKDIDIKSPTNQQAKECAQVLREWYGNPKRSQGSMRWLVPPLINDLEIFFPNGY